MKIISYIVIGFLSLSFVACEENSPTDQGAIDEFQDRNRAEKDRVQKRINRLYEENKLDIEPSIEAYEYEMSLIDKTYKLRM